MDFKELLKKAGLTKAELGRQIDINERSVSRWGNHPPGYAIAYLERTIEYNEAKQVKLVIDEYNKR